MENEKTIVYKNQVIGDWVICANCGKKMLLPYGADKCPECNCDGSLMWVDDDFQEADAYSIGDTENKDRELKLEDYLSDETLSDNFPDYYKKLQKENNLSVETPENDIKEYAKKYGYAALGYALLKMIKEGNFKPDWEFAKSLWEWDGCACMMSAQEESVDEMN